MHLLLKLELPPLLKLLGEISQGKYCLIIVQLHLTHLMTLAILFNDLRQEDCFFICKGNFQAAWPFLHYWLICQIYWELLLIESLKHVRKAKPSFDDIHFIHSLFFSQLKDSNKCLFIFLTFSRTENQSPTSSDSENKQSGGGVSMLLKLVFLAVVVFLVYLVVINMNPSAEDKIPLTYEDSNV